MDEFLQAVITGLATAAILAVGASGLVLTYTTTGIFNFAHGAIGMLGAFAYWQLRFDWGWPAPLALFVVLGVLAPLVGLAIERGVMRQLEDAPESARVVVTVGLLAAALGLGLWVWNPDDPRPIQRFWGIASVELLGVRVSWHEVASFVIAVVLALGLRLLLYRTRAGLAMRASVDDRGLARLNGANPYRSAMLAWAIGCGTAALAGILISPTTTLTHVNLTLFIVNAYAAAMFGRLRNLPMTFLGAVILGLADAFALAYLPTDSVLLAQFRFAIPAILLFVVLLALPQSRLRGKATQSAREVVPRPPWTGSVATAACFVMAGLVIARIVSEPDAIQVQRIIAVAIIGLSLVPLVGYAGQMSLCQLSLAGIGALVMAHHGQGGGWDGLVLATVVTAAVGAVVALPTLRMAGIYLTLMTAAFAMVLDQWIFGLQRFEIGPLAIDLFGTGSVDVDDLDVPGVSTQADRVVFLSVVFALVYLLVVAIRRSTFGQQLLALKDSPAACATLGINPAMVKLAVFTLAAGMAGFGGALYGGTLGTISAQNFNFNLNLPLLLLAVVGGIGSPAGALAAGVLVGGLPLIVDVAPWFENVNRVLPGTLGVAMGRNPNGIVHSLREGFAPLRRVPALAVLAVVGVAGVVALRLAEVLTGLPFALALMAVPVLCGLAAQRLLGRRGRAAEPAGPPEVPLEWVGIVRPFEPADVAALDRELGLETPRLATAGTAPAGVAGVAGAEARP
ncbi:MAG TPA: ABC transporter permease [Acidimicrobiales bacterium]